MSRDRVFSGVPSGLTWARAWSQYLDDVIAELFETERAKFGQLESISLIATGGYGRQELCPYSDLDIAVVPQDEQVPGLDHAIRSLFNALHHRLGGELDLHVDYAYRVPADAAGLDPTTRTGLLEMRLIAGAFEPAQMLREAFWDDFPAGDFLIAKLEERQSQTAKTHTTPLVVTPNLKLGAGGLRDFQAANWVRLALHQTPVATSDSYDKVLMIRNCLHLLRDKEGNVLTHSAQSELAHKHDWNPLEMMHDIHKSMMCLRETWKETVSAISGWDFSLADRVDARSGRMEVHPDATASEAAIGLANAMKLGIKTAPVREIANSSLNVGQALRSLMHGQATIREMERANVLRFLLPEVANTLTLLPDDHSHSFTVFEHTLQATKNLEALPSNLAEVYARIQDKGALWLAVLMHDAGKADRSQPHSLSGERMVHEMASRWQLDQDRADLVAWLVRNHLLMSHTIRMRDVSHPETIREFVAGIPSLEHLLMLAVLTWVDTNAVGPEIWTPAQDGFLRELLERTESALTSEAHPIADPEVARSLLRRSLKHASHDDQEVQAFLNSMPAHYVLSTAPDAVQAHLELVQQARLGETVVAFSTNQKLGATDLTLAAGDQHGLLSRALGLIYLLDISVIGLLASTANDDSPIALDTFTLTFGGGLVPASTGSRLKQLLLTHLNEDPALLRLLQERGKTIDLYSGEATITFHEGNPGRLEFRGRRGRGLAYRLSRIIAREGWNVLGARIGQWAGQSTASITLTGPGGTRLKSSDVEQAFGGECSQRA